MNIAVMVKLVPNTETKFEIENGKVKESGFRYFINPYDEFAVEAISKRMKTMRKTHVFIC